MAGTRGTWPSARPTGQDHSPGARQAGGAVSLSEDAFLCAAQGVEIEVAFTKRLGAGLFGGEGFILQRLEGDGMAFVHAGGAIVKKELGAGETLRVDTGCLVAFAPSVEYDIQFVGGFKNALFGGEGLFLAVLKGPGVVYLQSLPFSRLATGSMRPRGFSRKARRKALPGSAAGCSRNPGGDSD